MAVLELKNVFCGYGGADVVKNVSLTVRAGETVSLAGLNGCGKTTLLRAVCGSIPVTGGKIFLDGEPLAELSTKERAKKIAMLSQTGAGGDYFGYTVTDTVLMGRYARQKGRLFSEITAEDRSAAEKYIDATGLSDCGNKAITELSGGQLQRVFLARAFAQEPEILLLDEPANHLDIKSRSELADILKAFASSGRIVIGVFHDISFAAAVSDKMLLMRDGENVLYGDTADVINSEKLSEVFETDVKKHMKKICEIWRE